MTSTHIPNITKQQWAKMSITSTIIILAIVLNGFRVESTGASLKNPFLVALIVATIANGIFGAVTLYRD